MTPLSCAVERAPLQTIELMFAHGGSTAYGQLLNFASNRNDPDSVSVLQYLLDRGARANDTLWENQPRLRHWAMVGAETPLHGAAAAGNIETVRLLLRNGADPKKRSLGFDKLPVDVAIACGNLEVVKVLEAWPLNTPDTDIMFCQS